MLTPTQRLINRLLTLRNRHFFGLDLLLLSFSPWLAFAIRTDGLNTQPEGWAILSGFGVGLVTYTLIALVVRLLVFSGFGLYRRYWRYASIEELDLIAWAVFISTAILVGLVFLARLPQVAVTGFPLWNFPRSVVLIDGLLVLILVGGLRFSVRLATRRQLSGQSLQRVLVMGAGDAGAMIVREMVNNPRLGLEPVGFLDDDLGKHDVRIHGVPVLGDRGDIPHLVKEHKINQVVIAMPAAPGKTIRQIVHVCEEAGVQTRIMPGLYELLDGTVSVNQLRTVDVADLLRREPVQTDVAAVRALIRGKRVLVTGGGGSIGSELCRQIWRCGPAALVILGHGENSIFDIENELRRTAPGERPTVTVELGDKPAFGASGAVRSSLTTIIADIRFPDRVRQVFEQVQPQIVFHAAAHKHVPLMEGNPAEAITNNVLGTRAVVAASLAVGVERFVMISTDKAVNPTSIMGASKRAAELVVHSAAERSGRPYVAVRFGNVLGSRGSVIHTFKRQIEAGGPVTVTHPDMQRYFMTIPEAVQLVLHAAVLGQCGEVYVLDMGKPVKIADLARDMIALSGFEVGQDIEIEFVGMRPGEKLFEELFVDGETYARTHHEKIFIATTASTLASGHVDESIDALAVAAQRDDREAILLGLRSLIPEFQPAGEGVVGQGKQAPAAGERPTFVRQSSPAPHPAGLA